MSSKLPQHDRTAQGSPIWSSPQTLERPRRRCHWRLTCKYKSCSFHTFRASPNDQTIPNPPVNETFTDEAGTTKVPLWVPSRRQATLYWPTSHHVRNNKICGSQTRARGMLGPISQAKYWTLYINAEYLQSGLVAVTKDSLCEI